MERDLRRTPDPLARYECHIAAALVVGGAGVLSAGVGAVAASSAASTQANAAKNAQDIMHQQYLQTRGDLLPYNTAGQAANAQISGMAPFSFAPSMATLENSPGYQFNLYQGLKATQNAAAARGLGVSGAALKGAAGYASGLAANQYQNLFQNALSTYGTNLGRLQQQAGLGENAAAMTGNYGTQTAANIGQAAIGAANAQAAGTVGVANALSGGVQGLGNAYLLSQLFGGGAGAGGMYGASSTGFGNLSAGIGNPDLAAAAGA